MITTTTTRLMTVSWNIAYGKNGFPRFWTSCLVAGELVAARLQAADGFESRHAHGVGLPRVVGATRPARAGGSGSGSM